MSIDTRNGGPGPGGWPFLRLVPSPASGLPPAPPARQLWTEFGRRAAARPLAGLRVLVLGLDAAPLALVREELRSGGARVVVATATVAPLTEDSRNCRGYDVVLVNFDRFADTEAGVEAMLEFRRACPGVAVVLVSARVGADDAGAERRAICDATLRSPFTGARLAAGLRAALDNAGAARF